MKIDKHVYFPVELDFEISSYCKQNNITYSKAVCILCELALKGTDLTEQNIQAQKKLDSILKIGNLIFELSKQIYSDLDFDPANITNVTKSIPVNEFLKKARGNKSID